MDAELRLHKDSAESGAMTQLGRTRWRGRSRLVAIVAVALIVILHKAHRRRLAARKLIARHDAQAVRSGGRLDSFDHGQAPLRFHREHRGYAWRIEVSVDDRDLAAFHRQGCRDIHREHALADSAARAGNSDCRADAGKVDANPFA